LELAETPAAAASNKKPRPQKAEAQPWPNNLPEQVRSVAALLAKADTAVPLSHIEASFTTRGAWKKSLPLILETLEAMGRSRNEGDGLWRAQQSLHALH